MQTPGPIGDKLGVTAVVMAIVAAIIIVPFLRERARAINYRQEILNGQIEQTAGEVRWRLGRLIAQTADRQLRSICGPLTLPPGKYRFYFLPETGGLRCCLLRKPASRIDFAFKKIGRPCETYPRMIE